MKRPGIAPVSAAAALAWLGAGSGCTQVRGRKIAQEANELFKQGRYEEAVARFEEAEVLVPEFPTLQLNKGYTCRQIVIPGSKSAASLKAAECAIAAFKKFMAMRPGDPRGEQLLIQTLFDSDQFEVLEKMFIERHQRAPCDVDVVSTVQQIYAKWDKFDEALEWYRKAAECKPADAEKQYSVGVFIWQRLFTKGGGADFGSYDPRPYGEWKEKIEGKRRPPPMPQGLAAPPIAAAGGIVGQQRVDLADIGIKYLERAIALRPKYQEAMTYLNLLYRQKSFAYFDDVPKWQENVDKAKEWMDKSLGLLREQGGYKPPPAASGPPGPSPGPTASPGATPAAPAPPSPSPPAPVHP